jgi:predicted TIM-barrel fold metal-dependent hydrolase
MTTALLGDTARDSVWTGQVIDVDVHANVPSIQALFPYLSQLWIDWINERGWKGPTGPANHYPPNAVRSCRPQWRPAGRFPASGADLLSEHILEPWRTETAILTCYYGIDSLRHPDWAAALASAVNDWLIAEWLERDPRLRATMVIPARDVKEMVKEIHRIGSHPGIVQVLLPVRNDQLWGQRQFFPLYEAIVEHDLVAGIHYGGTTDGPPSTTGFPSWFIEEYSGEWQAFASQVTSLVSEGVFQSVPQLRVSVLEGGFLWLPVWGWRMNKEWKGLRREVPWLDRPPFDIIRDHFRFSVAPTDAGPRDMLAKTVSWLRSDDLLMFATDYPHTHDDDISMLLDVLPEPAQAKLMSENARAWYRL